MDEMEIEAETGKGVEIEMQGETRRRGGASPGIGKLIGRRKGMNRETWIIPMGIPMVKHMMKNLRGSLLKRKMGMIVRIKMGRMGQRKMVKRNPNLEDLLEILEVNLERNLKCRWIRMKRRPKMLKLRKKRKVLQQKETTEATGKILLILMWISKEVRRKSLGLNLDQRKEDVLEKGDLDLGLEAEEEGEVVVAMEGDLGPGRE